MDISDLEQPLWSPDESAPRDSGPGVAIWADVSRRIDTSGKVGALGPDLFGDQVGLADGSLSFPVTDVSLPGNHALPVAFGRYLQVNNRKEMINDSPLADWHLDLPRISGTYATDWLASWPGDPGRRCPATTPAGHLPSANPRMVPLRDIWQGARLLLAMARLASPPPASWARPAPARRHGALPALHSSPGVLHLPGHGTYNQPLATEG